MSNNDNLENKLKEFWNLQLQLNKYVGETEREVDPSIRPILKNIQVPDWFNSSFVFSPLILAMDDHIQALEDELVESQDTLKKLYQSQKKKDKEIEQKQDKEINDLNQKIETLNGEIEEIKSAKYSKNEDFFQKRFQEYFESEFKRYQEEILYLKNEYQEYTDLIQAYVNEIEISTNQIVAACEEHKKNIVLAKKYKQQISELDLAKKIAQKSSEKLAKRVENLQVTVERLISLKEENDRTLEALKKEQEDFELVKVQFEKVNQSIRTSQEKQEEVLDEMIKAVELAENSSANVQMYQSEVQMFETENERLKSLVSNVENNLNNMVSDFGKKADKYYGFVFDQISSRMSVLKSEYIKLLNEKDVIEQRIEIALHKNSVITPNCKAPDFLNSNSAGHILKLKNDVDQIISQKEKVFKENANLRDKISKNREKLLNSGHTKRRTISKLQHKRQQSEVDLSILRSNLKSLIQKNGIVSEGNEKLKCNINQIRRASTLSLAQDLQQKEEEIRKIESQIDAEEKEHQFKVENMKQDISKFQTIAENFSVEKNQNEKMHLSKTKEINAAIQDSKQKIKYLKSIVQQNMDEILKGQTILKETQDQIDFLSNETNRLLKKERHQISLMNDAKRDQIAIASDIQRFNEVENKLDKEIEIQKRKLISPENNIQFDLSDNDPGIDPI